MFHPTQLYWWIIILKTLAKQDKKTPFEKNLLRKENPHNKFKTNTKNKAYKKENQNSYKNKLEK